MTHNFYNDLLFEKRSKAKYEKAIKKFFPSVLTWVEITDLAEQKKGIDYLVKLPGELVKVQFKIRKKNYGDLLVEWKSINNNTSASTAGWIEADDQQEDILIYIVPNHFYCLDYKKLHNSWLVNKDSWINSYKLPPASNPNYQTFNVGIPIEILTSSSLIISMWEKEKKENE
jgi:hypothetical protein